MEAAMEIGEEVMGHLSQMFDEIEMAITSCPHDLWHRKGVKGMMVPAVLAAHAVWCIRLRHLLNIPLNKLPSRKRVPTQEQLVAVLDAIRSYTASVYGRMGDATYLTKEGNGAAPISRVMYTIAHTRHHLGQLVQILKENGIKPPKWYPR
jgi:hypothetical protein